MTVHEFVIGFLLISNFINLFEETVKDITSSLQNLTVNELFYTIIIFLGMSSLRISSTAYLPALI